MTQSHVLSPLSERRDALASPGRDGPCNLAQRTVVSMAERYLEVIVTTRARQFTARFWWLIAIASAAVGVLVAAWLRL